MDIEEALERQGLTDIELEDLCEGVKNNSDIWPGAAVGTLGLSAQEMDSTGWESYDNLMEDIEAFMAENYLNRPAHTLGSFALARATMKSIDVSEKYDPELKTKAAVSFTTVTAAGLYKELELDKKLDPYDMAANYTGWGLAVMYELKD